MPSNPNLQKIIKLTQNQYDILSNGGTVGDYKGLNDNYLYLIQDNNEYATVDYVDDKVDGISKAYVGLIGTANDYANSTFYLLNVMPNSWNGTWRVKYRVDARLDEGLTPDNHDLYHSTHECEIVGARGITLANSFFNGINNTSYRCVFYNATHTTTEEGFNSGHPHKIGVELTSSSNPTNSSYKRTITITLLSYEGCTVTFNDEPEIPATSSRADYIKLDSAYYPHGIDSNAPGYCYRGDLYSQGLRETGDNDTMTRLLYDSLYVGVSNSLGLCGYSLFGFTPKGEIQAISKYNQSYASTTDNISADRVYNEGGFDWSRGLYRWISYGYIAEGTPFASNLISFDKSAAYFNFRYTDNVSASNNTELTIVAGKPIYLRGTIGSNGLFYLAPISVTYNGATYRRAWTQDIPTEDDGYVYWLVGYPYSATTHSVNVKLYVDNPLYWYKYGIFREYDPGYVGVKRYI